MKLKLIVIIMSLIIINLTIIYNINKNIVLKKYNKIKICELDIKINQDQKLNLFLKNEFKNNKNEFKNNLDSFYKEILFSYFYQKKIRQNYIEDLADKKKKKFSFSKFVVNNKDNKIFFKYSLLNTNFNEKYYLRKILKQDIDNNIKYWAYNILIKEIDSDLKKLNILNNFNNNKKFTREDHLFFINSKDYKNIYLLENIKCDMYESTFNIFFTINFILLFFIIIYLLLHNKKKLK